MSPARLYPALILALFTLVGGLGCEEKGDDVAQIRALVEAAVQAAEAHDISELMEPTTSDFAAGPGSYDAQRARGALFIAFRRYGRFDVIHPAPGIRLGDDARTAEVSLPFLIVREGDEAASKAASLPEEEGSWLQAVTDTIGDPYKLDLSLKKDAEGWKVRRAEIRGVKRLDEI